MLAAAVFVTQSVCLGFWGFEPVTAGDCRGDEEFWQVLVSTGVSGSGVGSRDRVPARVGVRKAVVRGSDHKPIYFVRVMMDAE